jgi:3-oxoacyl-[acyl-carrier protein] reductase
MNTFEGKVALVTGSGRGIGRCVAERLGAEGARLVINDVDPEPAQEVVDAIKNAGGEAMACPGSVTAPDFAERIVGAALERYKGIDIVVNNAGYTWDGAVHRMTDEQWYAMLDCHLTAPFRILRAAGNFFRAAFKQESEAGKEVYRKVVNVSSLAGVGGNAGQANYSAAKAGVIGLTKTLAKEWGRYRVNVNCVAFGLIRTRLTTISAADNVTMTIDGRNLKVGVSPVLMEALEKSSPFGRGGTPEEGAGAIYLLCRPEANFISGHTLICSGAVMI